MKKLIPFILFLLVFTASHAGGGFSAEYDFSSIGGDNDLQIKLYPSPFKNELGLDFVSKSSVSYVEIKFISLIGKEMDIKFDFPVNGTSEHFELDLKLLPSGIYFMEITAHQPNGSLTKYTRKVTKL